MQDERTDSDELSIDGPRGEERQRRDSLIVGVVKQVNERLRRRREARDSLPPSGSEDLSSSGEWSDRPSGLRSVGPPVHDDDDEAGVA